MELSQSMPKARVQIAHPALAILGLMIGSFVGMFSETALNIALPSLMGSLGVTQGTVQWLVTGYMLVIGICMPLSSLLTRRFTTKPIVLFALGAFMVGAIISAVGTVFPVVLIGRMIQGIGTGLVLPLMFSVAMQIFPPYQLGTVMGMAALVIMFAPAIGPTLTGLVLAVSTWHTIFWLFVPVLAIAFVLTAIAMENIYPQTGQKIDWLSILESTVGFGGIVIGTSMASDAGWLALPVLFALIVGIIGLVAYALRQLHTETPMLNLRVFNNRAFTTGTLLVMLDFGVILAAMYLLPSYLQRTMGLPVAMTGLIMLPGGVVNAAVSAIAGRSYDRYGAKWLTRIGFIIAMVGVVLLLATNAHSSLVQVIAGHVILMIGAPLAMSPAQTYALNSLSGAESADGSAILNTLQQIVGAVATAIATSMVAVGTAQQSGVAGQTLGSHFGFAFVLILALVAFGISWAVQGKVVSHDEQI
ncbi:DHA2 family efflux MFS transporter permease subunit [Lacticaseibacillus nasuensis]|uniref:DHA2 family efflux MFS transporter permease subunit n=1 Tax=Lacticaseibacillus nasuensis TaxID=944671 RepID=UPI0022480525|nr:DHA2 family efflux MFS transporter permease subunit [Lacticaseibacillus nasuensis]MCX2455762.1 DHA2 family efflux MFS transporter permease subunit [Lacticaseibacillus nasuensis]